MLGDLEASFAGNGLDQGLEIVTFEERSLAALPAQEQVLVTAAGCEVVSRYPFEDEVFG